MKAERHTFLHRFKFICFTLFILGVLLKKISSECDTHSPLETRSASPSIHLSQHLIFFFPPTSPSLSPCHFLSQHLTIFSSRFHLSIILSLSPPLFPAPGHLFLASPLYPTLSLFLTTPGKFSLTSPLSSAL